MIFGDVIQLQDADGIKDYVFLGTPSDGGVIFLARIPDSTQSKQILDQQNRLLTNPTRGATVRKLNHEIYFLVELTTKEFVDRVAWLGSPDHDESEIQKQVATLQRLDESDVMLIKDKIKSASQNSVNPKLRKLVEDLEQ